MTKQFAILATAFLVTAGCKVGPNYHTPDVAVADQFDVGPMLLPRTVRLSAPTTQAAATQLTAASTQPSAIAIGPATPVDLSRWWESFGDRELDSLVEQAAANNDDLAMAVARLQQARLGVAVVDANGLPAFEFSAGAGRGSGTNSTKGRVSAPLNAGSDTGKADEITEVAGFDAGWELDLWGQLARVVEAARANAQAAEEDRRYVLASVIADTARNYAQLRAQQAQAKITQATVAALERTVELTRVRLQRQLGNELDVVLAERQLSASLAQVAPLSAEIRSTERRIAVLIGQSPESLYAELDQPAAALNAVNDFDIGIPLQALRRRPDVRRQERQLAAATARVGVATGDLFPNIALTAGVGIQGQGLGRAPVGEDTLWSIGPALRVPIFDFGALDAVVQVQNYRVQELTADYRKTVLGAVEEAEDAMNNYDAERNRLDQLGVAVAASQRAVNLATERFDLGLTDFLNVLDAQQQLYDLQQQLAVCQQATMTDLIALYKSLGGGWEHFNAVPAPAKPRPAIIAAVEAASTK